MQAIMPSHYSIAPQRYARLGGLLYLATIAFGAFSEGYVFFNTLVVPSDSAATASHVLASRDLWNLAVGVDLLVPLLAVVGVWISYVLLRPVSRTLVLLDVFLTLVSVAVEAVSKLFLLAVLPILTSTSALPALNQGQPETMAALVLKAHGIAFNIALIFFGAACLVEGYLLFKSGYFPKFIGVLVQIAGIAYLISCFAELLAPALANRMNPAILLPPLVGELAYCLWLLIKGVDLAKWHEQVSGSVAKGPPR